MGRLSGKKPNVPKVALQDYFYLIAGIPKVGKTTLFAELVEKEFGDLNAGLLIAFEKGYKALNVIAEDVEDWDDFADMVDELIEEKDDLPYKMIGLDTVDIMYDMAVDKVIKEWNAKNPNKRTSDIGGVGAKGQSDVGYGEGYARVRKKIKGELIRLNKAGYGIFCISHSKHKKTVQRDGLEYDELIISLSGSAREVFVNEADFVVFITNEKTKEKGDVVSNRYMYFRPDGYVEAGGRFRDVPEKIEYDVGKFSEVIKTAIATKIKEMGIDIDNLAEEQAEEKEKKSAEFIEKEKENNLTASELIQRIDDAIQMTEIPKKDIGKEFKQILGNTNNYKIIDDTDLLKECLAFLQQ